jgi:hypothetical protein
MGSLAVPSSLRASNSLAKLDLYVPPYEKRTASAVEQVATEFSDMGISQHRRRESFPVSPFLSLITSLSQIHSNVACSSWISTRNSQ